MKNKSPLPVLVRKHLFDMLGYPQNKLYAQVATHLNEKSNIRTMRLFEISPEGDLLFLTNTQTQKCKELRAHPHMAITLVDHPLGIQIISRGMVQVVTNNCEMRNRCWQQVRSDVKKTYQLSGQLKNEALAPENFAIIILTPDYWEILELNKNDYSLSRKICFSCTNNSWKETFDIVNS